MRRFYILPGILAAAVLGTPQVSAAAKVRFFQPEPGFTRVRDLPEDFLAEVDTIRFRIMDAFEGADAHTKAERWAFGWGNKLHIESREGTLRHRLLIEEGKAATKGLLVESEKALRDEIFLADAVLEVGPDRGGRRTVKVTTYDQWTTSIIASAALEKGDLFTNVLLWRWEALKRQEWRYGFGLWESNVLGTGTRMGASFRHELERNVVEGLLTNQSFSRHNFQGSLYAAYLSDGHSYHAKLALPLRSRTARYGFEASASSLKLAEKIYFDANRLDELPDVLRKDKRGDAHLVREYRGVTHDSLYLSATRSFGRNLKINVGPFFFFQDRYQDGATEDMDTALADAAPLAPSAAGPWLRTDALLGAFVSLYVYDYKTARNFRNLKWNETVETGWKVTARAAHNQEWLGAGNSDLWLAQEASYGQAWKDRWYAACSLSVDYFLSPAEGEVEDGRTKAFFEGQWKPVQLTSTVLTGSWQHLFAAPASRAIGLGASDGLSGYPSFYYSGRARALFIAEQRLFPEFELATIVPSYTLFLAAGNTYPTYRDFEASDLHYSLGFGVRLGRSKSPTKGVQHINVSWPLGEEGLPGLAVSIIAKKNL